MTRSPDLPPERRHADDHDGPQVRHCPFCGRALDVESFVQEYWTGGTRNFHLWCPDCAETADVVSQGDVKRVETHEPAH